MNTAGADRPEGVALEPEELARANLYGLVSRLFYAPPDPNLLAEISRSPAGAGVEVDGEGGSASPAIRREGEGETGENTLAAKWQKLREACGNAYPAIARQEYEGLFIGVGKAAVTPYLSAYAEPHSPERYLVRLREQLGAWGLTRRDSVFEVEDHISGVSDVMRWLIEGAQPLGVQRAFFEDFVYPGAIPFLAAVKKTPSIVLYPHVASFTLQFLEVEKAAFEMEDPA